MAGSSRRPRPEDIWPGERRPPGAFWRDHSRVASESLAFVSRRLPATLLVWILIGTALTLPAALYFFEAMLARAAGDWQRTTGFSVYYEAGVEASVPEELAHRLASHPDVEDVRLITPAQALAELRRHAEFADAIELIDNPLPTTIRASVGTGVPVARLTALASEAEHSLGVEDVVVESAWLQRLAAIREVMQRLFWLLAGLLGIGAVLVSSAAVRLAIELRLAELDVLVLVGAGRGFIRRPFLYLGGIYGVGGAVVAAMLLSAGLMWLEDPLARLFGSYGQGLESLGFDPIFIIGLFASGVSLGVLGAVVASHQRLRSIVT